MSPGAEDSQAKAMMRRGIGMRCAGEGRKPGPEFGTLVGRESEGFERGRECDPGLGELGDEAKALQLGERRFGSLLGESAIVP